MKSKKLLLGKLYSVWLAVQIGCQVYASYMFWDVPMYLQSVT